MKKRMNKNNLQEQVIEEFSGENAQKNYIQMAGNGFWISEAHHISRYFTKKKGKLLDLGCGTGRTTIPLQQKGYAVIGVDLVPTMIRNAKKIAKEKGMDMDYEVGDALQLRFNDNTFDYILFSNQGWTQIPGADNRLKALSEMHRVLKKGGILIFTAHPRIWSLETVPGSQMPMCLFWTKQWICLNILKPLGFHIEEQDFGDRFFERETNDTRKTYTTRQYIHIPSRAEVCAQIEKIGFSILEVNGDLQISSADVRRYPPVFYICEK